jgi:hypothetical protein
LVDPLYAVSPNQVFTKDLALHSFTQELSIDTQKKTISGDGGSIQKDGYQIINSFTKYLIPFDAIRDGGKKPFRGKVRVVVYEFDRNSANELLHSDVFTDVRGYASQGLITYGMPLIFFYDQNGQRLEVYKEYPMQIWTTNRELNNLILDNSM